MFRRLVLTLLTVSGSLVVLGGGAVRSQPSFDCAKASTSIEHLICGDDGLQKLDVRLAAAFRAAREKLSETERRSVLDEQRRWLRSLGATCNTTGDGTAAADVVAPAVRCLAEQYEIRIAAIEKPMPAQVEVSGQTVSPTAVAPASAAGLAATIFPAAAYQETLLNVEKFGRYAITVKSRHGTALQLIDFMAGPGELAGTAGREDGRLDAFLDRGSYKLVMLGGDAGVAAGEEANLTLHPFREAAAGEAPMLPPIRFVSTELTDFQQRSYWIKLDQPGPVVIEAAGRYLGDLRLWRDGTWLVDTTNSIADSEPKAGEPLSVRRLNAIVPAGLYKVIAYGGRGKPWTTGSTATPLFIRSGFPSLDLDTPVRLTASPFGTDRYLVAHEAGYARLELAAPKQASLALGPYAPNVPFAGGGAEATINEKSRLPRAEVGGYGTYGGTDKQMVTVGASPGETYTLEVLHQNPGNEVPIPVSATGLYWLSVVPSGPIIDLIHETAMLIHYATAPNGPKNVIVPSVTASTALPVSQATQLKRRFNLLETTMLFIQVDQPGDYRFSTSGDGNADFLVEPLFPPLQYQRPGYLPSGRTWSLSEGYYRVTLEPTLEGKGISDLVIEGTVGGAERINPPRQFATRLPSIHLDSNGRYMLWINRRPEISNSVILRALPNDLGRNLPVLLAPKEATELSVTAAKAGILAVGSVDAAPIPVAIDGASPVANPSIDQGDHRLGLKNDTDQPQFVLVGMTPPKDPNADKLPNLPGDALGAIPVFPKLDPARPAFGNLAHDSSDTYSIEVPAPGLYRLETTGLLATSGGLRNRVIVQLASAEANGIGRNFLIQQYLSTGSYQVTLSPTGTSAGDYGVTLASTPVEDGGELTDGVAARATLRPGHSLAYSFEIKNEGRYRLETLGFNRQFAIRLEDGEGWPIIKPNTTRPVEQVFRPGRYRVVLLPQALEGRVITTLTAVPAPVELTGHGPFALPWDATKSKEWDEPEAGAARTPDQWRFVLPAPAEVTIDISADMVGTLMGEAVGATASSVTGGKPSPRRLDAGAYRLDIVSARPDNRRTYTVRLTSTELLPGQFRSITAPALLKLSVGADQAVEIGSFGGTDTRARLFKDDGLIAANDDRPNDWNFAITRRLEPGLYRLQVDPADGGSVATTIAAMPLDEVAEPALTMPAGATVTDAKVHVFPLDLAKRPGLVVAAAQSRNAVDLAIERRASGSDSWQMVGTVSGRDPHLTLLHTGDDDAAYRLRAWATDHTTSPISVKAGLATPAPVDEALATGQTGTALLAASPIAPDLGVALVKLAQPGIFRLIDGAGVKVAASTDAPLQIAGDRAVIGQSGWIAVAAPLGAGHPDHVRAQRIDFAERDQITLDLPASAAEVALAPAKGNEQLVVWLAESLLGQPSIRAGGMGAVASHSAIAVGPGLPTDKSGLLRLANGEGKQPPTIKLTRAGFALAPLPMMQHGMADLALPPGKAVQLPLGPDAALARLSLTLPARTMAALTGKSGVELIWTGDAASVYRIDGAYDRVLLAHLGRDTPNASVQAAPLTSDLVKDHLSAGDTFRELFATAGVVELEAQSGHLRIFGGEATARFFDSDRIVTGSDIDLPSQAHVSLRHGPGLLVARLDEPNSKRTGSTPKQIDKLPATLPLSGEVMSLSVAGDRSRLIELLTTSSVMITTQLGSAAPRLDAFADGAKLTVYAPQGVARFDLEAAGPGKLSGVAQLRTTPIVPIGEGLGPKVRLAPGEARGYAFSVPDRRRIGVGVRASVDVARCRLLDAQGATLGVGVTQLNELPAGDYVLLVEVPLEAAPVDVEPALIGVKLPDTGPPDNVKRSYLALVGGKPKS